jgi:hypothetical protein
MNKVPDGAKADLEFYYDVNKQITTTTFSNTDLETRISQNKIFLDKELTTPIGNYVFNFIYSKDINIDVCNTSVIFDNYTDLRGGFEGSEINKSTINPGFINPNSYSVYNIYTGSASFLGATGFMVILSDSTSIRHAFVYFAK